MANINIDTILTTLYYCLPIVFSLISFYYAFYYLKAARTIEDTPTSRIRSAAQGFVELNGSAKPLLSQPVLGKLTGTPCGWYRYTIELFTVRIIEKTPTYYWELIEEGISSDPFLLNDGTGECAILPEGAEVTPTRFIRWRDHSRRPGPPPTSFWKWLFWNSWGPYRFTEHRIELETPLYTTGMYYTLDKSHPNVNDIPELSLYLTEKNTSTINVLCKDGLSPDQNYLISSVPEKILIRRYRIKAFIFFLSFLLFIFLSLNTSFPNIKHSLQNWQSQLRLHLNH